MPQLPPEPPGLQLQWSSPALPSSKQHPLTSAPGLSLPDSWLPSPHLSLSQASVTSLGYPHLMYSLPPQEGPITPPTLLGEPMTCHHLQ